MKTISDIYYSLRSWVSRGNRNAEFTTNRPDPVRALARNSKWASQGRTQVQVDPTGNLPWAEY